MSPPGRGAAVGDALQLVLTGVFEGDAGVASRTSSCGPRTAIILLPRHQDARGASSSLIRTFATSRWPLWLRCAQSLRYGPADLVPSGPFSTW